MLEVWVRFSSSALLGGLPLIAWITYGLTKRQLSELGTGGISVSAAFYHGGKLAGILAVLSRGFWNCRRNACSCLLSI